MINPYHPGDAWYYAFGGTVLTPKEIFNNVKASGYRGYMEEDIEKASQKQEPQRSAALRRIRQGALTDLFRNLSRYREVVRELRSYRDQNETVNASPVCDDVHVNVSLKHNHLYNDFAHLIRIHDLLSRHPDLFDF